MARNTTSKRPTAKSAGTRLAGANPLELRKSSAAAYAVDSRVHVIRTGIRCDTESRGHATPQGQSRLELVLDASEGFIPLWARDTTLRWRFRESSLQSFENPADAKAAIQELFAEALVKWGDAAPIKFTHDDDAWDFEIVMREADSCNISGCVLASAFFPDAGRHDLRLYPKLFDQPKQEQVETLIHEIGHVFGLRHFFAQVKETGFPSVVFGKHNKFTIMNYGANSKLTSQDRADLTKLYQQAWAGELTQVNGTPIKFVTPFHTIGESAENAAAVGQTQAGAQSPRKRRRG